MTRSEVRCERPDPTSNHKTADIPSGYMATPIVAFYSPSAEINFYPLKGYFLPFTYYKPLEGKMSDQHFTNIFNVTGNGNTINVNQHIDAGSDGAEVAGMAMKFVLAFVGLLLSPILIPILLTANGIKMIKGDSDYGDR